MSYIVKKLSKGTPRPIFGKQAKSSRLARLIDLDKIVDRINSIFTTVKEDITSVQEQLPEYDVPKMSVFVISQSGTDDPTIEETIRDDFGIAETLTLTRGDVGIYVIEEIPEEVNNVDMNASYLPEFGEGVQVMKFATLLPTGPGEYTLTTTEFDLGTGYAQFADGVLDTLNFKPVLKIMKL